jgi:predicted dehydrogenase
MRAKTYLRLAARRPEQFRLAALADPDPVRRAQVTELAGGAAVAVFDDAEALLAQPRLADVAVVATQDRQHYEHALQAMRRGYDLLLEKPVAARLEDVLALDREAAALGRRVLVCHVLRYTPYYRKVKEIVDSGELGELVTVDAREGIEPWHFAHSYVRGHYAVMESSAPTIVAKCCHDMDLLHWILDRPCRALASFGGLSIFDPRHRPRGSTERCTDGCPHAETCQWNALRYTGDMRGWLRLVCDLDDKGQATREQIVDWLRASAWGRCVFLGGNTALDGQVLAMTFEGGIRATFTMTAFDSGRSIHICGTRGHLMGGQHMRALCGVDIVVVDHARGRRRVVKVDHAGDGHMGGDEGLVNALYGCMRRDEPAGMHSSLHGAVESHVMAFAAEASRTRGRVIDLAAFRRGHERQAASAGPLTGN